jgi:hypothetical protein
MPRPARVTPVVLIAIALIALLSATASWFWDGPARARRPVAAPTTFPTAPAPALTPDRVVAAVLAALKDNDPATNAGLRTTFRFASPANRQFTGPEDRFVAMVKQPPYGALINHRSSRVMPIEVDEAHALMVVRVVAPDLRRAYFKWTLSRQTADGPLKDCWMTDGVSPSPPPPGEDAAEERI